MAGRTSLMEWPLGPIRNAAAWGRVCTWAWRTEKSDEVSVEGSGSSGQVDHHDMMAWHVA